MDGIDTKAKIQTVAIDLFAQDGYEKTTMRGIAEKVGITPASIYYFFASKASILQAIFVEFEANFAKYRNNPQTIFQAAQSQPLDEVLRMIFYTFGGPAERDRMMAISRVILSLQYENAGAAELYERIMIQDAQNYGVEVFRGLYEMGRIRKIDFSWVTFIFHAFAMALFEQNVRHMKSFLEGNREYEEGIVYICSKFAAIIES